MPKLFSKSNLPYFAVAVACLIWGAASPVFKWSLTNIPPFTLAYLRFSLASLLLLPFAYKRLHVDKGDIKTIIAIGFTGITLNISFFFLGLERTSSLNSSLIIASEPLFLITFSLIFLKEKIRRNIIFGMLVSLAGFFIVIEKSLFGENHGTLLGDFFILLATLAYVTSTILSKEIFSKYEAITVTFWSFIVGTLSFLPLLIYEAMHPLWLTGLKVNGLIGIAFGAVLSSAVAYYLYNWGIKRVDVSKSAVFNYLNPISGILLAIPLLGEKPSFFFIIGSLLVFLGVYVTKHHRVRSLREKPINDIINPISNIKTQISNLNLKSENL